MISTLRIIGQVIYFAISYVFSRLLSLFVKSNGKEESQIKVIRNRLHNTIFCYLIENRGVSKVSIIIPSYNEESSIASVIDACLLEPNVEIIVSDGGSNDRTKQICETYGSKIKLISGNRCIVVIFDFLNKSTPRWLKSCRMPEHRGQGRFQ